MLYRDNNIDRISNKESLRRSHRGNGWDMKIYDQGRTNIKIVSNYIDRCFGRSIGKNFDKVKKQIYEKMRHHISSRYDTFARRRSTYRPRSTTRHILRDFG